MINQSRRDQLVDAYVSFIPLIQLNLFWFLASLPLVTVIPATAALFYATNRLAHGKSASWGTFVEGFRLYLRSCWLWGLLNVFVVVGLVSNFLFYTVNGSSLAIWARAVVIVLAGLWFAVQLYVFPLMIEQEQPHLRTALRNSFVVIIKRPLPTLGMTVLVGGIAIISTVIIQPAWIFISASACAYLANRATLSAIAKLTGKADDIQTTGVP